MSCPSCGHPGTRVDLVTLRSLVVPEEQGRIASERDYAFCRTDRCDTVYFSSDADAVFTVSDLAVPVFEKSASPDRLVCYCFEHRVSDVVAQVEATGESRISEAVAAKCRQGLDRCEETNPAGHCCVGQIRALERERA